MLTCSIGTGSASLAEPDVLIPLTMQSVKVYFMKVVWSPSGLLISNTTFLMALPLQQ